MNNLYNITIHIYIALIRISSIFNSKSRLWIQGRKNLFYRLKKEIANSDNIVWFHCSSLGEFEQGKPVIYAYQEKYPNHNILLTVFSPSAYEICKKEKSINWVYYLPADTKSNAKKFINIINPIKVIFIKNELWINYMRIIKKKKIPFYLICSVFNNNHLFIKNKWLSKQLNTITHFFVQDQNSKKALQTININNCTVSGDSRFDSVIIKSKLEEEIPFVKDFCKQKDTIICGSTWRNDENILNKFIKNNSQYNYIIAPHELNYIQKIKQETDGILFSKIKKQTDISNIIIIDNIGLLSSIYKYGKIAYIGGGFNKGIHNILEPAVFGLPIIFGPKYKKSLEASELIKLKGAKTIKSYLELKNSIFKFANFDTKITREYVHSKSGTTNKIINKI